MKYQAVALKIIALSVSLLLISSPAYSLPNFAKYHEFTVRKQKFIEYLLPLAKAANAQIMSDREKLIALDNQQVSSLGYFNTHWLQAKCQEYQVTPCDLNKSATWNELLNRVDIIPTSLILAQGATESGWGTSRFARQGNNLFGQWCFSNSCTIVPHLDHTTTGHGIRNFSSVEDSVEAYLLNINTGHSYIKFRAIRQNLRANHKSLTSYALANGLENYSTRGQDYINQIKSMVTANNLVVYDV